MAMDKWRADILDQATALPDSVRHAFFHGRYEAALRRIMEFGYSDGHAKGFTCAEMAADALGEPRKKRSGDRGNHIPPA